MVERTDEDMVLRLIGRIKLLIAMDDEILVEKKLSRPQPRRISGNDAG